MLRSINIGRMRWKRDGKYQATCPEWNVPPLDMTSEDIEDLGTSISQFLLFYQPCIDVIIILAIYKLG